MQNLGHTQTFDEKIQQRGHALLDTLFSNTPDLRSRIQIKSPRQCHHREVIFNVECESNDELSQILHALCHWLQTEDGQDELESLMLF
jgi:hypothetical protein